MKPESSTIAPAPYRFGFVLNTTIGNLTRYVNLRKYAERDPAVEFVWAPVHHYMPGGQEGWWRFMPHAIRSRAFVLRQTAPVYSRLGSLDAVMVHLFEADILLLLRRYLKSRPLLFSSTDEAPIVNRSTYPLYPSEVNKPRWRQQLRLALDMWRVRHTDYFIPFSSWVANILSGSCKAPSDHVHPIHVGLDLELWPPVVRTAPAQPNGRIKLLFVGGDFVRKGGDLLLQVFLQRFVDAAELHLVTAQAPHELPTNVYAYRDFKPNDPRLRDLYAECDLLVVPTTADTGPLWVFMEAMASGIPIIGTDTGSNSELVRHGDTGYIVPIGDAHALGDAIQKLIDAPGLRTQMGRMGRALVESQYSAAINVPRILQVMKDAVDARCKT